MGALVSEIKEVFGAYGIKIDPRHLSIIADYVTQHGLYRPFNRYVLWCFILPFPLKTLNPYDVEF